MIEFKDVSFQYEQGSSKGKIENINLTIHDGEVVLICGESGCGKTTLTRLINGLIPHYYEGTLTGQTIVEGVDVKNVSLYALSGVVGSVFQNPRTQFFTVDTTSEIAFGCENLGIDAEEINSRIERTVDELKIEDLLNRSLFALSGGSLYQERGSNSSDEPRYARDGCGCEPAELYRVSGAVQTHGYGVRV